MVRRIEEEPREFIPGYPNYNADNIRDLLDFREAITEDHARTYETWLNERRKFIQRLQFPIRMVSPSESTSGRVSLPLVGHDPKRDRPNTLKDVLLFEEEKLTLFDASGELEARIPGRFVRWAFGSGWENQFPEELLKSHVWASGVVIGFRFRRRFGKPNDSYILEHVDNSNIDEGKRILTTQGELKAIGLDIKR